MAGCRLSEPMVIALASYCSLTEHPFGRDRKQGDESHLSETETVKADLNRCEAELDSQ
jgi:hypothetical protein